MKKIIYTDGSSSGNPGPGGYAAVITDGKMVWEIGDYEPKTTNNRMELKAVIEGLKKIEIGESVKIITDSSYVVRGIGEWIEGWIMNNWITKTKQQVANQDLWQELYDLVQDRNVEWLLIKGHATVAGNNRADMLATTFSTEVVPIMYSGPKSDYKIDLTEPTHLQIANDKNDAKMKKGSKAYSYLSLVNGVLNKHKTWSECESRVKGKAGAKFRKATSPEEESSILRDWGCN
jgi:ribonuclease HI